VSTSSEPRVEGRTSAGPVALQSGPPSGASALSIAGFSDAWLRFVALLAFLASLLGRSIAPALPGSRAGIARWITLSEQAAELLSQAFALAGIMLIVRLGFTSLRERSLGIVYRLAAAPATACIVTLVMWSTSQHLAPEFTLGLAFSSAVLALAASAPAIGSSHTRALGFVLLFAGSAAFAHVIAAVLAVRASDRALLPLFAAARTLATLAFVLDFVCLVIAGLWAAARRWVPAGVVAGIVVLVSLLVAWGASRGSEYNASLWQVLAARGLSQIAPQPAPFVVPWLRHAVEVLAPLTAIAVLFARARPGKVQAAVAFAVLARGSTDVPALALVLSLSALLAALSSIESKSAPSALATAEPEPLPTAPQGHG
jgi:hypothetical protein